MRKNYGTNERTNEREPQQTAPPAHFEMTNISLNIHLSATEYSAAIPTSFELSSLFSAAGATMKATMILLLFIVCYSLLGRTDRRADRHNGSVAWSKTSWRCLVARRCYFSFSLLPSAINNKMFKKPLAIR